MPKKKHLAVAVSGDRLPRASEQLRPQDSLYGVTQYFGSKFWATNKRFEWARDSRNHHYEFTRFYFECNVLVDVWPRINGGTRKEAEKKKACVDTENVKRVERGDKPLGYLSFVRGAVVPNAAFDKALAGETLELIEPTVNEGVLV